MDEAIPMTQKAVDYLRHIRSNSKKISQKEQRVRKIDARVMDDEAKIAIIAEEYKDVETDEELLEGQGRIEQIGSNIDRLEVLKVKLTEEIDEHKLELLDARECLEEELCRLLLAAGQLDASDSSSDVVSDVMEEVTYDQDQPLVENGEGRTEEMDLGAENPGPSTEEITSEDDPIRKAMSLLGATKEALTAANSNFHRIDRVCAAQRHDFETGAISEFLDMSRTEFDLEQLAQQIEITRELIAAERAYSEAGRYALEVGFIREDSNQSCHFLDDVDDGLCSGNPYEKSVENKDMSFIEAWLEKIESPSSSCASISDGDSWEVDSVKFGEGCSTHADEWCKVKIDRFEALRETERTKLREAGIFTSADAIVDPRSPVLALQEPEQAVPFSGQQDLGIGSTRVAPFKPPFAAMKELLWSGQVAVGRFQAAWLSRRGGDDILRG